MSPSLSADASSRAVSVVIPVLNDAAQLQRNLPVVMQGESTEVIVVDGGSDDASCQVAEECGAAVIQSTRGRGRQMNAGAAAARSQYLCFLHADTTPPVGYVHEVERILQQPNVCVGAFRFALDDEAVVYRAIELGVALRCRLMRLPYGDQGMFVAQRLFFERGGFSTAPMEDLRFVWSGRNLGRVVVSSMPAITSARRWRRHGIMRVTMSNTMALMKFALTQGRDSCSERSAVKLSERQVENVVYQELPR